MRPRIHGYRPYVCIARSNSAAACGKSPLRRLRDYYMGEGASDSVIIDLSRGGYVPFIRTVASGGSQPRDAPCRPFAAVLSWFRLGKSTLRKKAPTQNPRPASPD